MQEHGQQLDLQRRPRTPTGHLQGLAMLQRAAAPEAHLQEALLALGREGAGRVLGLALPGAAHRFLAGEGGGAGAGPVPRVGPCRLQQLGRRRCGGYRLSGRAGGQLPCGGAGLVLYMACVSARCRDAWGGPASGQRRGWQQPPACKLEDTQVTSRPAQARLRQPGQLSSTALKRASTTASVTLESCHALGCSGRPLTSRFRSKPVQACTSS